MNIGQKIKQARIKLEINQAQLAKKAGISKSFLSEIEGGKKDNMTINVLRKITKALNVSYEYLLDDGLIYQERKKMNEDEVINLTEDVSVIRNKHGWLYLFYSELGELIHFYRVKK